MKDVVIIGAGIAGMTAAIYLARAGKSVLVLESKAYGGQIINTVNIENWPGALGISGAKLSEEIYHQMNKLGAEFKYEEVLGIENSAGDVPGRVPAELAGAEGPERMPREGEGTAGPAENYFVINTDEGKYSCRAVILAVGTEPRKLSEKQAKDAGKRPISYCATCDGALYKGKPVVVVGSGNSAKHEIRYLEGVCTKVYHIHHDDPIPEEAEAVFVAIGRVPGTEFLRGVLELDENGYIVAGEDCETSLPGVFAAGDCRTKTVRQLVTAAGDGSVAAGAALKYLG